jgi:predicted alpha/beta hydrolase family esterase
MIVRKVLFIQGGGDDGYEADRALVASLKENLGSEYQINYPKIQSDETSSDYGWIKQIRENIDEVNQDLIIVGHSFGASMILKYFSENPVSRTIKGAFLVATPFWDRSVDWQRGLALNENFADKLPVEIPLFLYHCQGDEEIPFSHFDQYEQKLTKAMFRIIESGGHQLNNDLTLVASDIKSL